MIKSISMTIKIGILVITILAGMLSLHYMSIDDIKIDLEIKRDSFFFNGNKRDSEVKSVDTAVLIPEWKKDFPVIDSRLIPAPEMIAGLAAAIPEGMKKTLASDNIDLYFDPDTTSFAVTDRTTGDIWTSGPTDTAFEKIATGSKLKSLQALISIDYYTADGTVQSFDSYNHSVESSQFTYEIKGDRIEILYEIGRKKSVTSNDVPNVISSERFEHFLSMMEAGQAKDVKARYRFYSLPEIRKEDIEKLKKEYPRIVDNDIYVLKNKEDLLLPYIKEYLEKAGYTLEDLEKDNIENGIKTTVYEAEIFTVPFSLMLEDNRFVVEVDTANISQPESTPIKDIHVLPNFGAANLKSKGYMFIPDGPGGLVYLNNNTTTNETARIRLYGPDLAIRKTESDFPARSAPLPVYGMKNDDAALFAVVESGVSCSTVNYTSPGYLNTYNSIWASFNIKPNDTYEALGSNYLGSAVNILLYPEIDYNKPLRVSYGLLHGDKASYSGFASYYRDYLQQNKMMTSKKKENTDIPFVVETIGSIDKKESLFGLISYNREIILTTFKQTTEIIDKLKAEGVSNISLRLSGWMNKGLNQTQPDSIKVIPKLGGKNGLDVFLKEMTEKSVDAYADVQIQRIRNEGAFYNKKNRAVRYLGNTYANLYEYDLPSGLRLMNRDPDQLLTALKFKEVSESVADYFSTNDISGISINGLARDLYSDFSESNYLDRDESLMKTNEAIGILAQNRKTMFDGCNSYAIPNADIFVNIPLTGSGSRKVNESVPFLQMVFHGYIDYAGEPLNHSDDSGTHALRSVEYGAVPYFQWAYLPSSITKGTPYNKMFSLCFKTTIDSAAEYYEKVKEDISEFRGETITYHENLTSTLTVTEFESKSRLYVNYDFADVSVDGNLVPARNWIILEG